MKWQKQVANDDHRFKILRCGRRCFSKGTKVLTENGYKNIENIKKGELVVSYGSSAELKEVVNTFKFGVDTSPKPMLEYYIDGKHFKSTYDHELYDGKNWHRAIDITWGAMETSQRLQFKLLCEQYGQTIDHEQTQQEGLGGSNEASVRRFWLFKNSNERQDNKNTQSGGSDVDKKSSRQATNKPQRQQPHKQQDRKLGVGHAKRECRIHDTTGQTEQEQWREVRNTHSQGKGRYSNAGILGQVANQHDGYCERAVENVSYKSGLDKGYFIGQDLEVSSVKVCPSEVTYDLEVKDNHNYVVNDLLVHNTGKTYFIIIDSVSLAAKYPGISLGYVGLSYSHAKDVVWEDYLKVAGGLIEYKNSQELLIRFKNGSRIRLYSWDSIDNMLGKKYHKVYLDEAAVARNLRKSWDDVIEPTLLDYHGEAWFTSMPRGKGQFKKMIDDSKAFDDWVDFHFTSYDNESIPNVKEELDSKRKKIAPSVFAQQYLAEFTDVKGRIYTEFNRDDTLKDIPFVVDRWGFSVDFGYNHPLAAYVYAIGKDDQIHVFKELYARQLDDQQRIKRIRELVEGYEIDVAVADSEDPLAIAQLNRELPFQVKPAEKPKGSVKEGIRRVKSAFHSGELTINEACTNLVDELEVYSWKLDKNDEETEKPVKENDDACDSVRYFVTMMTEKSLVTMDDIAL